MLRSWANRRTRDEAPAKPTVRVFLLQYRETQASKAISPRGASHDGGGRSTEVEVELGGLPNNPMHQGDLVCTTVARGDTDRFPE